jgi:hypothetical protein
MGAIPSFFQIAGWAQSSRGRGREFRTPGPTNTNTEGTDAIPLTDDIPLCLSDGLTYVPSASFASLYDTYEKKRHAVSNSYAFVSTLALARSNQKCFMKQAEKITEPPSCHGMPIFMIGRDSRGNWVAQEQGGARGGLFADRAAALKFAKSENGDRPYTVVWVSSILELDTGASSFLMSDHRADIDTVRLGRVARAA